MTQSDSELLRRYVADRSEKAFAELVGRHIDLVYSAALRQANGDAHFAEDLTQGVFESLAAKAARLTGHTSLAGWLHTTTRYLASNLRRSERRRVMREQEAHAMNQLLQSAQPPLDWEQLRPVIDDTMGELEEEDREAVLLKYFQGCPLAEIGARLGIKENTARMRIERSLDRLRVALAKRGITSTAAVLAMSLANHAVSAAPAGLAAQVCAAAVAGAGAAAGGGLAALLGSTAAKLGVAALLVAAVAVPVLRYAQSGRDATAPSAVPTTAETANPQANAGTAMPPAESNQPSGAAAVSGPKLLLYLDDPKTGQPVPGVQIDDRCWSKSGFKKAQYRTGQDCYCEVSYPSNTTELELTTRLDGYADTRLDWHPNQGEVIPESYRVHLARAVLIGGRVVDEQGRGVAGAKVGWNHEDAPGASTPPESHEFGWIEVATDDDGRWQINRIAPEMLRRLYGGARHPDYVDTPLVFIAREPAAEQALRNGSYVFRLGTGITIQGLVKDPDGLPVGGARVTVGYVSASDGRQTTTGDDGAFVISGCKPGNNLLTAAAAGYASTTREVNLSSNSAPFEITLQKGKLLRLLIRNRAGDPVAGANAWLDTINQGPVNSPHFNAKRAQVDFNGKTGPDGRLVWTNAPDGELKFQFSASGYMRSGDIYLTADGDEHVITLDPALTISGTVRDSDSGEPVPHFRIGIGWLQADPFKNRTNGQWSSIARFWPEFSGGQYRHVIEEPALGGTPNPGYVLKFEADGYSSFISRSISANEGEVQLDVTLHHAGTSVVTVLDPDGRPAAFADVGLVSPGAHLHLAPGGFSRESGNSADLLTTDSSGNIKFTPDETVSRVVLVDSSGYLETTPDALERSPTVTLQPWGRIEGLCLSAGQPVAGREYLFKLDGQDDSSIASDFMAYRAESDADGKVVFPKVPPGKHQLTRLIRQTDNSNHSMWMHGDNTDVTVQPGETTSVTFGNEGYVVTANLQWPGGAQPTNVQVNAFLHTPLPRPAQEMNGRPDLIRQFYQSPEYLAATAAAHHYPMVLGADGTLTAEAVPPGNYRLSVMVMLMEPNGNPGHGLSGRDISVTVPADPPTGRLDVGTVEIVELPVPPGDAR